MPSFGLGTGACDLLATPIFPNVFNFFRGVGGGAAAATTTSSGEEDEISVSVPIGLISSISARSSSSSLSVSLAPPECSLLLPLPLPLSSSVSPSIISMSNPASLPSLPSPLLLPWLPSSSLSELGNPCIFSILNSGLPDSAEDAGDGIFSFIAACASSDASSDVSSDASSDSAFASGSSPSPSLSSDKFPSSKLSKSTSLIALSSCACCKFSKSNIISSASFSPDTATSVSTDLSPWTTNSFTSFISFLLFTPPSDNDV